MDYQKVSILFQPSGRRGEVDRGKTILEAARDLGIEIESPCGGNHTCGKCRVRAATDLLENSASATLQPNLSPFTEEESRFIEEPDRQAGYRLACVAQLQDEAQIYVPEESRGQKQIIRKEAGKISFELNPGVKNCYIEMIPPTLNDPQGDFERVRGALQKSHGLGDLSIDYPALLTLPQRLRLGNWKVTAQVWMDREVLDVQPGRLEDSYGLAIDIGTTTVAAYLCHLLNGQIVGTDSIMNPQVSYGEDVMARITYSMVNPQDGLKRMREAIIEALNGLTRSVAVQAGIQPEQIIEISIVGNTAMHHIFLGIDPIALGLSPFPPAIHQALDIKARDLGLRIHPAANVHILPNEAGFVGADNVGVLIATRPYDFDDIVLIIDIGTNGELVLGNKKRLISSSCATGPALEGAHLAFGMRAASGAIEKVRIDPKTYEVRFKVIGSEKWNDECAPSEVQARGICGSGIIEALAEMFKAGVMEKSGRINGRIHSPRLRKTEKGFEFIIARTEETAIDHEITVSVSDIRAVQLAKAAIYAGAKVMMGVLGVDRLNQVMLAGAFGTSIDRERAMILGMFPDCAPERVISVGNAAGDGARLALLNREKREEANRVARRVEYIELTAEPEFNQEFIEALAIPHAKDLFPHLEEILQPLS